MDDHKQVTGNARFLLKPNMFVPAISKEMLHHKPW